MYAAYFGLKENPFKLTPEPRYLFLSEPHRDVLLYLAYGIKERKGLCPDFRRHRHRQNHHLPHVT
ncbi:MAG: hypothetical protein MZV70_74090 [Desulfobacterales bacterium]|nr:hypothetical protein [Desulfobacterales bacterium]